MAEATFVREGTAIDHTPGSDVAAGEVVVQGDLVGVAKTPIASGELGSLDVAGVFAFAKGGSGINIGVKVYWDDSANQATTTASSNKLIGKCVRAAAAGDSTVEVRLNQ